MEDLSKQFSPELLNTVRNILEKKEDVALTETEHLDELSKKTLGSYIKKASIDKGASRFVAGTVTGVRHADPHLTHGKKEALKDHGDKLDKKGDKRQKGIAKAVDRLTKEEAEPIEEISAEKLAAYKEKALDQVRKHERGAQLTTPFHKDDDRSPNDIRRAHSRIAAKRAAGASRAHYHHDNSALGKAVRQIHKTTGDVVRSVRKEEVEMLTTNEIENLNKIAQDFDSGKLVVEKRGRPSKWQTEHDPKTGKLRYKKDEHGQKIAHDHKPAGGGEEGDHVQHQHVGRDPRHHIQVKAGEAAGGKHVHFKHDDGSESTITPSKGRHIVNHLNSLKPADRHEHVKKLHASAKNMP